MEKIVTNSSFDIDLRTKAAAAIGTAETTDAQATTLRIITNLDASNDDVPAVLQKLTDALGSRAATEDQAADLVHLAAHAQQRPTRIAAAESLLRSTDQSVKDRVARLWNEPDDQQLDALLAASALVPADQVKPYQEKVQVQLQAKQDDVRHDAMIALGHVGDASTVKLLLDLAARQIDRVAAASALAQIAPDTAPDDQVLAVAKLLTTCSSAMRAARITTLTPKSSPPPRSSPRISASPKPTPRNS